MDRTPPLSLVSSVCLTLVLVVAGPVALRAQGGGRSPVPAEVSAAMEFVLLAYPDLMTRPVNVTVNVAGRTVAVTVSDAPTSASATPREPLLQAAVTWAEGGELETYAATGVLVERTRNEALVKTLAEHPDWTDSDADAALQAMGGRPSTGAAPTSPMDDASKLDRFVGSDARKVGDSTLRWRPSKNGGASERFAAVPGWTTEVTARKRDGTAVAYRLVFEPFGGRLVMVTQP
jgi:hypothetical protein